MPNQTKTIGAAGDYSTIAAWEAASDVSSGWWKGEIIDAAEFAENVTFSGTTGTPTASNYVWLTVASGVRHSGKAGTGHARIKSSVGGHILTIWENFSRVEYLEIEQASSGISDEGIRMISGVTDVVISRSIIHCSSSIADQDGIYAGDWAVSRINIDNCIIYGFARAGIHAQNYQGSGTQTWFIDSCTIVKCGAVSEAESGGINATEINTSNSTTINVYNTGCFDTLGGYGDFSDTNSAVGSPATWVGTNNACSDTSLTFVGLTTGAQESLVLTATTQPSGSYFVVKNITAASEDYQLLDDAAGNLAYGNAVDRVGSEPDSRQDFSLDIVGNVRSTSSPLPDIGASEYPVAGGTSINATLATKTLSTFNAVVKAEVDTSITATLATKTFTAKNAVVSLGTVIIANLATKTFTSYNAIVSTNSDVNITAVLAQKNYQTFNAIVKADIDVNIAATLATKSLQTFNAVVSQATAIQATLAQKTLTTFNATVKLVTDTAITATLATKTFTAFNAVVSLDVAIKASLATKTLTSFNATVLLVGNDTAIVAKLVTKKYTTFPAAVFTGEVSIKARRIFKRIKSFNAVISHIPAPIYSIDHLNNTVLNALEDPDEQQRMLIENFNILKDLVVTPAYGSLYGDMNATLSLTTTYLKVTNFPYHALIHKNCNPNKVTGVHNLFFKGIYKFNIFMYFNGSNTDQYKITVFVNGVDSGIFFIVDVHAAGRGYAAAILVDEIKEDLSFIDLRIKMTSGSSSLDLLSAGFFVERVDNTGVRT